MSGKIRRGLLFTSNDEVMITTKQIHVYTYLVFEYTPLGTSLFSLSISTNVI